MAVIVSTDLKKNKDPSWVTYIKGRIKKHQNMLLAIIGKTGSGKSYAGLSIAEMLDKNFTVDRVIFGFRDLMRVINSGETFKPGTCFVWDEFQIDAGSRDWQSVANRLINSLLSTFRHKNFILIITTPYLDFIDNQSRKLLHAEMETKKIDYKKKETKLKPQLIQYNGRNKKFYYKYLRIRTAKGIRPIVSWSIKKPSKELVEAYEAKKTEFTTKLNQGIEAQLNDIENNKKPKEKKPLTLLQMESMRLRAKYNDSKKVAKAMGLTVRTVNFHISQALKKGYTIEEFAVETPEKTPKT